MDSDVFHSYLPSGCQVVIGHILPLLLHNYSTDGIIGLVDHEQMESGGNDILMRVQQEHDCRNDAKRQMYFNLLFTEQRHRLDGFIEPNLCASRIRLL